MDAEMPSCDVQEQALVPERLKERELGLYHYDKLLEPVDDPA
jgi:hypothetical protein